MDAERAGEELQVIRQLMERPVRYSTQSGLSGILAGLAALIGIAVDWYVCEISDRVTAMWINVAVWSGVFLSAFTAAVVLTRLRERRQGMPFWSPVKRRVLRTILPPFVAGVGLTAAVMYRWYAEIGPNQWGLIPAIWMTFYGTALWQVGEFGVREIRLLGVAFILAGLVAGAFYQHTIPGLEPGMAMYWTLGITFGGFHLVYGTIVLLRHGG